MHHGLVCEPLDRGIVLNLSYYRRSLRQGKADNLVCQDSLNQLNGL
jgi:hypothetical protein